MLSGLSAVSFRSSLFMYLYTLLYVNCLPCYPSKFNIIRALAFLQAGLEMNVVPCLRRKNPNHPYKLPQNGESQGHFLCPEDGGHARVWTLKIAPENVENHPMVAIKSKG